MPQLYKIMFDFWTRLKSGQFKNSIKALRKTTLYQTLLPLSMRES